MAGFYRLTLLLTSGVLLSTSIKYVWRHVIASTKKVAGAPTEPTEAAESTDTSRTRKPTETTESPNVTEPTNVAETTETKRKKKETGTRPERSETKERKVLTQDSKLPQVEDHIQTVLGLIHRDTLGTTIVRDQILLDYREFKPKFLKGLGSERRKTNHEASYEEFTSFGEVTGGGAIVDVSPFTVNRDPAELAHLSIVSGVTIIMSTGDYIASSVTENIDLDQQTVSDIAVRYIYELEHGVGESGIKPGIIGEIGVSHAG